MPITDFQDLSVTKKTLALEIPAEKADATFAEVTRAYRNRAAIPGFRKGHAPEKVIRKRFADEIRQEALDRLIPETLFGALKEKGLEPVVSPQVEDLHVADGEPIRFKATVEVRPPIELGVYRGLAVPPFEAEPAADEIDQALRDLTEPAATYLPVEGRPAMRGDYVVADIVGTFPDGNGEPFDNPKAFIELGNERNFAEINDLVPGSERGATVEFEKTFEAEFPNPDLAGKRVKYAIAISEIKTKQLPAPDDEFAKASGLAENAAELREKVVESLRRRRTENGRQLARRAILDQLRAAHTFEVPAGLVDEEVDETLRRTAHELAERGVDLEKAGLDWQKLREEGRDGASRRVAERLILDAIAAKEEVQVAEAELDAEIRRMARQLGKDPSEFKHDLSHRGLLGDLKADLRRAKMMGELVATARTEGA